MPKRVLMEIPRGSAASPPRTAAGFTLVELMVVVALVGVLGSLGIASLSGRRRVEETRSLARNVQYAMLRARGGAVGDGFQRQVSCTASTCTLLVATTTGMGPAGGWQKGGSITTGGNEGLVWAIDAATDVHATDPGAGPLAGTRTITFYPDGTSTPATVFVTDLNGVLKYKVFVYAATGMPRLVDSW